MRVKIAGLDPHQQYYIAMDIIPVDNKRYRYVYHSSKWMVAGNADSPVPPRVYIHPDSPASGETWMRQVITKLKIDRNPFAKGFRDPGRNRGVLDGLLDSYPWRGPFSLDFKPFTIQLQGSIGSQTSAAGSYCLYSYSFPLSPQLTAISRHAKLAEDTTDFLLRQSAWHPTSNHCL
uniref:T-box 22 n=1 Tax=Nothobranchius kadleci TaxID=1051664 RepID=A0A1A8DHT3_NOTKA